MKKKIFFNNNGFKMEAILVVQQKTLLFVYITLPLGLGTKTMLNIFDRDRNRERLATTCYYY
jgi:hypothetical protein